MAYRVAYETAEDRKVALYCESGRYWTFRPDLMPATDYPTEAAAIAAAERVRVERARAGRVFVKVS